MYQVGKNSHVINRPPERFERYTGPLSIAIRKGLADGTVSPNANIKQLYYNAYDSILGMMQRLTVGVPSVMSLMPALGYMLCAICSRASLPQEMFNYMVGIFKFDSGLSYSSKCQYV